MLHADEPWDKEDCNRGHGLSVSIKLGTPEPKFLQSGSLVEKLTITYKGKRLCSLVFSTKKDCSVHTRVQ